MCMKRSVTTYVSIIGETILFDLCNIIYMSTHAACEDVDTSQHLSDLNLAMMTECHWTVESSGGLRLDRHNGYV